ncbi:unnamed protein product [Bathycoccus prasinos]
MCSLAGGVLSPVSSSSSSASRKRRQRRRSIRIGRENGRRSALVSSSLSSAFKEDERIAFLEAVKRNGFWCERTLGKPPKSVISAFEDGRDEELCAIVDENDFVVDFVPRKTTVKERLRGRGSYVLITTTNNTRGRAEEEGDVNDDAFKEMMASYLNNFERKFVPEKIDKEGYDAYETGKVVFRLRKMFEERASQTLEETRNARLGNLSVFSTKRSVKKDVWPGMYDVCTSGVQTAIDFVKREDHGRTYFDPYAQCAIREIEEELGISGVKLSIYARPPAEKSKQLQPIRKFAYSDRYMNIFGQCYKLEFDAAAEKKMAFLDGEVQEGSGVWLPLRLDDDEEKLVKLMHSVVPVGALCCASFLELMAKLDSVDYTNFTKNSEWIESWTSPKWKDRFVV